MTLKLATKKALVENNGELTKKMEQENKLFGAEDTFTERSNGGPKWLQKWQ